MVSRAWDHRQFSWLLPERLIPLSLPGFWVITKMQCSQAYCLSSLLRTPEHWPLCKRAGTSPEQIIWDTSPLRSVRIRRMTVYLNISLFFVHFHQLFHSSRSDWLLISRGDNRYQVLDSLLCPLQRIKAVSVDNDLLRPTNTTGNAKCGVTIVEVSNEGTPFARWAKVSYNCENLHTHMLT